MFPGAERGTAAAGSGTPATRAAPPGRQPGLEAAVGGRKEVAAVTRESLPAFGAGPDPGGGDGDCQVRARVMSPE